MGSTSDNLEDSHMDKTVQTDDQKEELPKDEKEKTNETEKLEGGGENGEGKIEYEKKTDEESMNAEEKKEDLNKLDVGMKNDEGKEGDVKEINEVKNDGARKEDVKKINEIDNSDAEKEVEEVKDGEAKKKDEENEGKAVEEKHTSEGVKERVVKIDQNPTFVEENGELNKNEKADAEDVSSCNVNVSSLSFKEESNLFSDLKQNEKKALVELRSKVEEAINGNQLFKVKESDVQERNEEKSSENSGEKEMEKPKENEGKEDVGDEGSEANSSMEENKDGMQEGPEKERVVAEAEEKKVQDQAMDGKGDYIDKDIKLWGVPLLPSKGGKATDVVLLKFLRAREFKVIDAFEMLRNTLQWRKENNIDSILDEDLGNEFRSTAYINGSDRQGHPVCYNVFGVLGGDEMFSKTLGTEENRDKFVRWRVQLMEEGIKKLDFNGVSCLLQIIDLKNTPGPSKKEVRLIMKQVISLLQDNYPEFVVKNIFINVPFWYYAFAAFFLPFLTQRTKSKFVYARPAKVIETLLKYIDAEEIPVCYGGLKRDNDSDFSAEDHAEEVLVKASSTETIEIPAPEAGSVLIWDLVVLGWEVNYKEEFVPDDDKSYTIIVQKERRMGIQEGPIRNSFKNNEPGKIVLVIGNAPFKNKKRAFYRYKIKNVSSAS
ncbi:hypothetical protein QUC31_002583 [Theobroma cacao]